MVSDYTVIIAAISQMHTRYQYQPFKKYTGRVLIAFNVTKRLIEEVKSEIDCLFNMG